MAEECGAIRETRRMDERGALARFSLKDGKSRLCIRWYSLPFAWETNLY
jgi:hypothetical protein